MGLLNSVPNKVSLHAITWTMKVLDDKTGRRDRGNKRCLIRNFISNQTFGDNQLVIDVGSGIEDSDEGEGHRKNGVYSKF